MGRPAGSFKRVRGMLVVLLVAAGLLASAAQAQADIPTKTITPGDINQFCVSQGYEGAQLVTANAYGWRCQKGTTRDSIDLDALCAGFAPQAIARLSDYNNPNSGWECWLTPTTVIGTVSKANIDDFCRRLGYAGAVLVSSNAYGWRCDAPNRRNRFSMTQLCRLVFQAPTAVDRIVNFYDPNSWTCRVSTGSR